MDIEHPKAGCPFMFIYRDQKLCAALSIDLVSAITSLKWTSQGWQPSTFKVSTCGLVACSASRNDVKRTHRAIECTVALRTILPQNMHCWKRAKLRRPATCLRMIRPALSLQKLLTPTTVSHGSTLLRTLRSMQDGPRWKTLYGTWALCSAIRTRAEGWHVRRSAFCTYLL